MFYTPSTNATSDLFLKGPVWSVRDYKARQKYSEEGVVGGFDGGYMHVISFLLAIQANWSGA